MHFMAIPEPLPVYAAQPDDLSHPETKKVVTKNTTPAVTQGHMTGGAVRDCPGASLQGYLAHKEQPPLRTLQ